MLHLYFELIGIKFTAGMKILNCMSLERKNAPDKKKLSCRLPAWMLKSPLEIPAIIPTPH